jgi:MFS family permease
MATPVPQPPADLPARRQRGGILRALSNRNYRLFFLGNGLSLIGSWMTNVAMAWMVFRLARDIDPVMAPVWLGYVAFASQVPTFLFSSLCGVYVDRHDRRRILVVTQILSMLQSLALAWLAFSGHATPTYLILLALVQGMINALDIPARQSFVVEMVEDPSHLSNAIALNSMMFNSARLIGPASGGLLIAAVGEAWCFTIDAISYAAVIASLLAMRLRPRVQPRAHPPVWESLREGYRYAFGFAPVRALILFLAVGSFVGACAPTVLPILAERFAPGRGAVLLGVASSCVGIGALVSAVYLASRQTVVGLGRVVTAAGLAYGLAVCAFALVPSIWIGAPILMLMGASFMAMFAGSNTMLQSMVDDHMRGRLMSFFSMAVMGMAPFGALAAGWLTKHTSPRVSLLAAGALCTSAAIAMTLQMPALRELIRPIYVRKGILPEAARGLSTISAERVESGTPA